ncbi:hypothetical protein ALO35_200038 [Pseudomonas amygdali pv. lachrymans]|uniref:DNA topoisomerase n=1 Tax=Pseudomonas amygdali pv. lachrymans TaxID=53707 RepID=A0A0P9SLJ5_PSEAV|nr:hypothetical protein ALO35_200038 [Pseudomonas amygdali pv. lachrymans]
MRLNTLKSRLYKAVSGPLKRPSPTSVSESGVASEPPQGPHISISYR